MTGFSAAAYREAHAPWTYTTARGRTYAARPLSTPRIVAFLGASEGASTHVRDREVTALLRDAFPKRLSFAWRGDPVDEILRAPPREREAVLSSFFASLGMQARPPRNPTSSRASSSR